MHNFMLSSKSLKNWQKRLTQKDNDKKEKKKLTIPLFY
jgi:hypothetical protein